MINATPGSVSHGTMRSEDLIPTFLYVLYGLDEVAAQHIVEQYDYSDNGDDPNAFDFDSEDASWMLESLFDTLNEYAPVGYYFGAHEGDGSDYGFWEDPMSL